VFGALIGAFTAGLHEFVDLAHRVIFRIAGSHSLSTGIGIDVGRVLWVPALGGLILGLGVIVMRRVRPTEVVDPIEANACTAGACR
jgi:CIC family chloride channel protein